MQYSYGGIVMYDELIGRFEQAVEKGEVTEAERLVEDFVSEEDDEGENSLNWEVFPEICDFALETINGSILSFAPSLQKKAYRKFLSLAALSEDDLLEELEDGYDFAAEGIDDFDLDEEDPLCGDLTLPEICKGLGIYAEDGEIVFHAFEYLEDEDQYISKEVLETLGWTVYEAGRNGGSRYSEPEFYYVIKSKNQR